jgi:hypothetical protein
MSTNHPRRNPILAELHAIRQQLAERFHNDLAAYSEAAEAHCRTLGFQVVPTPAQTAFGSQIARLDALPDESDPHAAHGLSR